jgi:hypothetical protein
MNLEFSLQIFEKSSTSNFMKIRLFSAKWLHVARQIDGDDEADSRFSQSCERA